MNLNTKSLIIASVTATPLFFWSAGAAALTPIEELGKNIFYDEISIPGNKQGCISCHEPSKGGTLPNSTINQTTVVAPGAAPHALGSIRAPTNEYASYSPPFQFSPAPFVVPWKGGNFWDGRAEGCGATGGTCPVGDGGVSETITANDLPSLKQAEYAKYLGSTADQALNPFPNNVEQNIREKNVCQKVKTAKYKKLYEEAFGQPIDCSPDPQLPVEQRAYHKSFKLIALSLAAYQASNEVNSFSSRRDKALACDTDKKFPLVCNSNSSLTFTAQENLGHDLFYGRNDSCQNPAGAPKESNSDQCKVNLPPAPNQPLPFPALPPTKNALCNVCHNGVPQGESPDPTGVAPHQLYTDNRYHNIGVPFNPEIPGVGIGEKTGLHAHVTSVAPGEFKTPTLRNVAKGASASFTKAYMRNGYFKSLESVVHFYNTRDVAPNDRCETLGIINATEKQALANNCWPKPEFAGAAVGVVGNLGLTFGPAVTDPNNISQVKANEEAALVAYLKTFSDVNTPAPPK